MKIEELVAFVETWGKKTLSDLRAEAEKEFNGTAFDCLRTESGERHLLVVCFTGAHQIGLVEQALDLVDDGITEDWKTLTFAEVLMRTFRGSGLSFESLKEADGSRSAIVLIATAPCSIEMLERLLGLRP